MIGSLLVLWLFLRFGLSLETTGAVFFGTRTLAALSQLVSPLLAARFGLIETMVFTHIPANTFLILAGLKFRPGNFPLLPEEGWMRGPIKSREATLFRADGVVIH
ncbi:MAG: hypothetical protein HYU27_07225 [Acidobacteria bacterium]|nr:hypothetical protein [Acidobacteriota bacterium]